MFPTDTPNPAAVMETACRAREQIEALSIAPTFEQADELYGDLLVGLCVLRGRGELDRAAHDLLAREAVRAMIRWDKSGECG